ncbi:MAG: hypothetical protein ACRCSN_10680 [Dermatophilaceae bacterium]
MIAARFALRLAFSRDRRHRWRQASVVAGAFVAALLAMAGLGALGASAAAEQRIAARSPAWAGPGAPEVLRVSLRGAYTDDGRQYPVLTLEAAPGHENDRRAVPPGLDRLPGPGEAVLSPGLVARGLSAPDFGLRPSTAGSGGTGVIGPAGLATDSEGWLYTGVPPGRTLGTGGALLSFAGYVPAAESGSVFETAPDLLPPAEMRLGVGLVLALPALVTLLAVCRASSRTRQHRALVLRELGVARHRVAAILAAETAALCAVGASLAAALWSLGLDDTQRVPLSGTVLLPGALQVPALGVVGSVLATVAIGAVAGALPDRRFIRQSPARLSPRRFVASQAVLVTALLAMAASRWLPPDSSAGRRLLFAGLVGTAVGIPLALPVVCDRLGAVLGRAAAPARWLGGRRLRHDAAALARPAAAVGLVVLFAGSAFALYGRLGVVEPNAGSDAGYARFLVDWRDERPGDVALAGAALESLDAIPTTNDDAGQRVHFDGCAQAQALADRYGWGVACRAGELTPAVLDRFRRDGDFGAVLSPPTVVPYSVLVLGPSGTNERAVMKALAGQLPAVNITQIARPKPPWGGAEWIVTGWAIGSAVLMLLLIREVGERVNRTAAVDHTPRRLGLAPRELARARAWAVYPPVLVAIVLGYLGAVVFALYGYGLGVTVNYLGRITAVAATAGILAVVSVAAASRSFAADAAEASRPYD